MMKRSIKDQAKAIFHEWKGTIENKVGKPARKQGLAAKSVAEAVAAKIQKKIGQVEKAVEKRSHR
jgi:uncharacterized protein YjbJ (UPF0337 family)